MMMPNANRPIEVLLFHLPAIARSSENEWASTFARSVLRQSKRPDWAPSPKQLGILNRLVSEMFADSGSDGEVIDED